MVYRAVDRDHYLFISDKVILFRRNDVKVSRRIENGCCLGFIEMNFRFQVLCHAFEENVIFVWAFRS